MSQPMWSSQSSHDFRRQSSSSVGPGKRVPYAINPNQPPTPSSMFDQSAGMHFASPSQYSQPPTPSSMLDPHMSHHSSVSSQGYGSAPAHPMARFMDNADAPYTAAHLSAPSIPNGSPYSHAPPSFMTMQPSVKSDSASIVTPLHPGDSGYFTHPSKTYSTGSAEPSAFDQDLPPEVISPMDHMRLPHKSPSRSRSTRDVPTSVPTAVHQAASVGDREELVCPYCPAKPRLKSELKKHILRHERPFKCDDPSCSRSQSGFTTPNDLDRHKRSKHNIFPDTAKVYICASPNCSEQGKAWPRYDNFKQHVERMHKTEDMDALLEASEQPATAISASRVVSNGSANGTAHDLKGIQASRDSHDGLGISRGFDEPSQYDEMQMFPDPTLEASRYAHSHSDELSQPDSLNDFDHGHAYPASVGHAAYPGFSSNQFDEHNLASSLDSPPMAQLPFGHVDPSPGKGPSIVVHNTQGQKQRQDQDLAHILAAGSASRPEADPLDDDTFHRILKDAQLDEWKSNPALSINGAQLASRNRQPLFSRFGKPSAKVYKANSVAGSRAQVTVVNNSRNSGERIQRSSVVPGAQCPQCKKILPRQCDLKKHERRHTRPFGCTFDLCSKQFGSKNDWKRHESSQHFQEEQWRCEMPAKAAGAGGQQCAKLYDEWDKFMGHLQKAHGVDEAGLEALRQSNRIGRNHQKTFWCGFCQGIVALKKMGRKAWDERFDHIGDHFLQDQLNIKDWVSPQGHRTKGQMRSDGQTGAWPAYSPADARKSSDDDEEEAGPGGNAAAGEETKMEAEGIGGGEIDGEAEMDVSGDESAAAAGDSADDDDKRQGSMSAEAMHFCCQCNDGPYSALTGHCACQTCGHSCRECFDKSKKTARRAEAS